MRRPLAVRGAVVLAAAMACCGAPPSATVTWGVLEISDSVVPLGPPELRYETPMWAEDSFPLTMPLSVNLDGQRLVVMDGGTNVVHVFDDRLEHRAVLGRPGPGPGELVTAGAVEVTDSGVAVLDLGSGDIERYAWSGLPVGTENLGRPGASFGILSDGRVVVPSTEAPALLDVRAPDGTWTALGAWPAGYETLPRMEGSDVVGSSQNLVLVAPGDTVHLWDNTRGVLAKVDPSGQVALARYLPERLLRAALERSHARLGRSMRQRLAFTIPVPHASLGPTNEIFLSLGLNEAVGLVVDGSTYRAALVARPSDLTTLPRGVIGPENALFLIHGGALQRRRMLR